MAKAVAEGAKNAGNPDVDLSYHVNAEELPVFDAILMGTPTYHHDMPIDMKKLFEDAAAKGVNLKGKVGAAFGSYGWSGEAPKFEMQVTEPPLLAKYVPGEKMLVLCRDFGKRVSETLMRQA